MADRNRIRVGNSNRLRGAMLAALLAVQALSDFVPFAVSSLPASAAPTQSTSAAKGKPTMTVTAPTMYSKNSYRGTPDLGLTAAIIDAGGGRGHFDGAKLFRVLADGKTKAETARLERMYAKAQIAAFMETLTFATNDLLQLFSYNHMAIPKPRVAPSDGRALAFAMYHDGIMPTGKYDCGYMMEHLMSHPIHVVLMHDISNAHGHGPRHNANFHVLLTRVVLDLKNAYRTSMRKQPPD